MDWLVDHPVILLTIEALTASGFGTIVAAAVTGKFSGPAKQKQAEPNGARKRLTDEVSWLRQQLEVERARKR